jgi:hypothetical protein
MQGRCGRGVARTIDATIRQPNGTQVLDAIPELDTVMISEKGATLGAVVVIATLAVATIGLASENEFLFFIGLVGVLISAGAALLLGD